MSWKFGDINFEDYGVFVSKSTGVLNLPRLKSIPNNWLDEDGSDYWQATGKYSDREIVLNCWMKDKNGYASFKSHVQSFLDAVKDAEVVSFETPYNTISNCRITAGVVVVREASYVSKLQAGTFTLRITVDGDLDFNQLNILRWTGIENEITAVVYTRDLKVSKTLQGDFVATCSFDTFEEIDLKYFDFIDVMSDGVRAERFHLNAIPPVRKISTNKFSYNLTFYHQSMWLDNSQFLNDRGEAEFYYFANLEEIIDLLVDNHDRGWWGNFVKGTIIHTERKNHMFSAESCLSVLKRLCEEYKVEYEFEYVSAGKYKINVKEKVGTTKDFTLQYGKNNSMFEITREAVDVSQLCTVLFAFGSEKNIPPDYRGGIRRLSFDGNPLSNNNDLYSGAGVYEKTIYFDDIYPNRTSQVSSYEQILPDDLTEIQKEIWRSGIFKMVDATLEFDIRDYLLGGLTAKISMKSGALAGYEFEIKKYDDDEKAIYIIPFKDENGYTVPNENLFISQDDYYTLIDISIPQSYIDVAEAELEVAAQEYIDYFSNPLVSYRVLTNPSLIYTLPVGFNVGDKVAVIDSDLNISKQLRISQLVFDDYTKVYEFILSDSSRLTYRQRMDLRLKAVEKAQELARKQNPESVRKDVMTTDELRRKLLDTDRDLLDSDMVVANETIDPRMLGYDAGVPQFYLEGALIEPNYNGDPDKFKIDNGRISISNWEENVLNRYDIQKLKDDAGIYDPTRSWEIEAEVIELDSNDEYFIYAKVDLRENSTICTIECSKDHREVKELIEDNYLIYKLGYISKDE